MDIVKFCGGLGNQMFQYAFMRALEAKRRTVKADISFYTKYPDAMPFCLTDVFPNIKIDFVPDDTFNELNIKWKRIRQNENELAYFLKDYANRFFWLEDPKEQYDANVFQTQNCMFVGYWQTEKYFKDITGEIRERFKFATGEKKLSLLKNDFLNSSNYISVHIRRRDYLEHPEIYGNICTDEYYANAMNFIQKKVENPLFVFFSDDIEWVKKRYDSNNCVFIDDTLFDVYQPWYDMSLMSCCTHNIIANSSFSWWSAWLNDNPEKIVIAPYRWQHEKEKKDIWCKNWIKLR